MVTFGENMKSMYIRVNQCKQLLLRTKTNMVTHDIVS